MPKLSILERLEKKSRKELQAIWLRLKLPTSVNKSKRELIGYINQYLNARRQWEIISRVGSKPRNN